jgi:hypothetical protein
MLIPEEGSGAPDPADAEEISASLLVDESGPAPVVRRTLDAPARPPTSGPLSARPASARPPPPHAPKSSAPPVPRRASSGPPSRLLPVASRPAPPPSRASELKHTEPLPTLALGAFPAISASPAPPMENSPPVPAVPAAPAAGAVGPMGAPEDPPTTPEMADGAPITVESLPTPSPERAHDDVEVSRLPLHGLGGSVQNAVKAASQGAAALARTVRPLLVAPESGWPAWTLPAATGAAIGFGVGLVAVLAAVSPAATVENPLAPVTPIAPTLQAVPTSAPAPQAPPPAVPAPPAASAAPAPPTPCTVAAPAQTVAPNATVTAGIELRAMGDAIALGFAPGEHEAVALRLDPASLAPFSTATIRSRGAVRRVTPLPSASGALGALVDSERKGDPVRGGRTIDADPPIQVGMGEGRLVWTKAGGSATAAARDAAHDLWALDGDGEIDAVRGASEQTANGGTLAVAFRRAGAVFVGMGAAGTDGTWEPKGDLTRFAAIGPAIGAPAVALKNGAVLVAWADRASTGEPWRLRWARFRAGDVPGEPVTFAPPGDKGEQEMSPSLAALPGGGFLVVWTEGPQSRHTVRALTVSDEGRPVGPALEISREGANAGQGQAVVTSSGRGVVAFFQSSDSGFELAATPVSCGI